MDSILNQRSWKLSGILNGIDVDLYDPENDPDIPAHYNVETATAGKAANKAALQARVGLEQRPDVPLIAMVTRLTGHKGIDLVKYILEKLLDRDVQMVILGSGEWMYENYFREVQNRYPGKFSYCAGFIPELAHKIYAAADIFLMPSKSEPCGLAQMVACRYGTLPIVRETGGLKDSIRDCGGENGNGFTFVTYNADDMLAAIDRALEAYACPERWPQLVRAAMECDFSWGRSANEYIRLYHQLLKE